MMSEISTAEQHGGTIYANSGGIGKGSTFMVCIPKGEPDLQFASQQEIKNSVWV